MEYPVGSLVVNLATNREQWEQGEEVARTVERALLMNAADTADDLFRQREEGIASWFLEATPESPKYIIFEIAIAPAMERSVFERLTGAVKTLDILQSDRTAREVKAPKPVSKPAAPKRPRRRVLRKRQQ